MEGATDQRTAFILFTDIHRSTQLWEKFPREFGRSLEQHNSLVEETVLSHKGEIMKNLGDGYIAIFDSSDECVRTGVEVQRKLRDVQPLPDGSEILVRVVGHGGPLQPLAAGRGYFGRPLNRASRICQVCHPGQMLVSGEVAEALHELPEEVQLFNLGRHHLRDLAEPEELLQVDHPQFPLHKFPPLPTLGNRPNNLVYQPNEFIGRAREMAELRELLLEKRRRLVTIAAPGGYGKSRLATQLCANLLDCYENGAFEILLAPVGSFGRLVGATADALRFQFFGRGEPKKQLIDYLREKNMLLSFDNFEHVIQGKDFLGEIIRCAPRVSILVTSREPLRLSGEMVYVLEPLRVTQVEDSGVAELPVDDAGNGHSRLKGQASSSLRPSCTSLLGHPVIGSPLGILSESVELFIDRALLVKRDLALTPENLAHISGLCEKLDGVPLAVELAAGWVDSFTLSELCSEVEQQLELTARVTDVPERQRSIRASLDWSYNLLSEEQSGVLRAASAFKGGFFFEAVAALVPEKSLRHTLTELSDKGWLFTREAREHTRFFIRDVATQQYVLERLEQSNDYENLVLAHARHFAEMVSCEGERLHGREQLHALVVFGLEWENIYKAMATALKLREPELLLPFAMHLSGYLAMVSRWRDGLACYGQMLEIARLLEDKCLLAYAMDGHALFLYYLGEISEAEKEQKDCLRIQNEIGCIRCAAASLSRLGVFAKAQGRFEDADKLHQESLSYFRQLDDRTGIARCLDNLGISAFGQGDYTKAERLHQESLAIEREIGIPTGIADSLHNLGILAYDQGRFAEAEEILQECLQVHYEIGNRARIAALLNNLGNLSRILENDIEAERLYRESLKISREIGDRLAVAASLNNLGALYARQDKAGDARTCLTEGIKAAEEIQSPEDIVCGAAVSAYLLATVGSWAAAAAIIAGAAQQAKAMSYVFEPMEQEFLDKGMAMLHTSPSADELTELFRKGEKMKLVELTEFIVQTLDDIAL